MAAMVQRTVRLGKLSAETTAFFLCDMQEKFRPTIRYFPEIITVAKWLVRMLNQLERALHLDGVTLMRFLADDFQSRELFY